ncbi:MAG: radical SAM protein [Anaerolineae bacterium]|nr:radical SAM protein [Anaerolineae bacterium]
MKIDIIVIYVPRYRLGHEKDFVPPLTGIHLAALTPPEHTVRVIHQQVTPVSLDTDADLIALSFFSGFADEAYRLADAFRTRGKCVVAGGPHVTFWPEEALAHCDAVCIGEADALWTRMLADAAAGRLQRRYQGSPPALDGIPTPRYDLLPDDFFIRRVVQATRGCPFSCSFCCVPGLNPGFRMRPIADVLHDIRYDAFPHWWQRKIIWFWDDNLTATREYVKDLLRAMMPLKRWWLTQASMDIAQDEELLDLMAVSGCIGVFFGIETFGPDALRAAHKPQNQADRYRRSIEALHKRGICVMAGFVAGFDGDTPESIVAMADQLYAIGVDAPFISVLTPYAGTALYTQLAAEGRLLTGQSSLASNGYNVAFVPRGMNPEALLQAHRALWRRAFSPGYTLRRIARAAHYLRPGALLLAAFLNGFYGLKRWRGNEPVIAAEVLHQAVT